METPATMKIGTCLAVAFGLALATLDAEQTRVLRTAKERMSYALGADLGNSLRQRSIAMDPALFSQALRDALAGAKTLLTDEEVRAAIASLQSEQKNKLAKNKAESEKFLAANKDKPGKVTLPNGLQYKILKAGKERRRVPMTRSSAIIEPRYLTEQRLTALISATSPRLSR